MQNLKHRNDKERGAALMLFTLMLATVVIPMIGLGIDGSFVYLAQARLNSAVDAAALAGGRSLNVGSDLASQKASAEATARNYFNANFPAGTLNTTGISVLATAAEASDHTRTVSVSANATVKLFFMNLLNKPTALVSTTAQSSKRDVNLILVLDRSGSMGNVCSTLIGNAQSFVDRFSNGRDTLGLITFMGSASSDYGSTMNFKTNSPSLSTKLASLKCGGGTAAADALSLARAQVNGQNLPGALNVIVFFTDGNPTVYSGSLPVKKGSSCAGGYGNSINGSLAQSTAHNPLGVYSSSAVSISTTANSFLSKSNCDYMNYPQGSQVANDLDYIPDSDANGNSGYSSGYATLTRATAGDGKQHITVTGSNIGAAATNATDYIANLIRNDGTVIYTIGLDGNGGVDDILLRRIANDPASNVYKTSQPIGRYYYSPNASQLVDAFNAVSSQLLRLAQ
jgi:Flp pilus assembly protein TadG